MMTADQFLARIERHLVKHRMTPSAFGRAAVNDPNLVGDLRAGRMPNLRTLARISEYMKSNPAEEAAA